MDRRIIIRRCVGAVDSQSEVGLSGLFAKEPVMERMATVREKDKGTECSLRIEGSVSKHERTSPVQYPPFEALTLRAAFTVIK